jgi:hypothetical protein
MTTSSKYNLKKSYLYPIVRLENALSSSVRNRIFRMTIFFLVFFMLILVAVAFMNHYGILGPSSEHVLDMLLPRMVGLMLLLFIFWVISFLLEGYFRSYYLKEGESGAVHGREKMSEDMFSFHVLRILLNVRNDDITEAFLLSGVGRTIMHRTGVSDESLREYLEKRDATRTYSMPDVSFERTFTLVDLVYYILENDEDLADHIFSLGIQKKECIGAATWVVDQIERSKHAKRWWAIENLEKVEGVGADWAYGQAVPSSAIRARAHWL